MDAPPAHVQPTGAEIKMDWAFHDLPAKAFPVVLRAYRVDSDKKVWEETLRDAGAVYIPPLQKRLGVPVRVEVEMADGTVIKASA